MRSWILVLVLGCRCGPPPVEGADSGIVGTRECEVVVEAAHPPAGSTDAYYRDDLVFTLSEPDPTATIETDIPGSPAWSDDGEALTWVLSAPLAPSTDYTATLHYCGGEAVLEFRTSTLGMPLEDRAGLAGRTYALDYGEAHVVAPDGVGGILLSYLSGASPLLLGVDSVDGGLATTLAPPAADAPVRQDWCEPTIDVPAAPFDEAPYMEAGPATLRLTAGGIPVAFEESWIAGTFAPDGSALHGVVLTALLDTRPLAPLLDDSSDEGALCDLSASFGSTCVACPADGEPFCLAFELDQLAAPLADGVTLVDIPAAGCAGCDTGPPEVCP